MARCHQATSHYLNQCWLRFMSSYGINGPQWVNEMLPCCCSELMKMIGYLSSNLVMTRDMPRLQNIANKINITAGGAVKKKNFLLQEHQQRTWHLTTMLLAKCHSFCLSFRLSCDLFTICLTTYDSLVVRLWNFKGACHYSSTLSVYVRYCNLFEDWVPSDKIDWLPIFKNKSNA